MIISAVLVLANLTDDYLQQSPNATADYSKLEFSVHKPLGWRQPPIVGVYGLSYGWPLYWHQYITINGYGPVVAGWCYSGPRLAANLALWLMMTVVPTAVCEALLRRYRPRLRWSLRTMLGGVGLLAVFLGWLVWARDRAAREDAIMDAIRQNHGEVWMERWGAKWLDLIGADRYRRRIVAVTLRATPGADTDQADAIGNLRRLSHVPSLRYLFLEGVDVSTELALTLGNLRSLTMLSVEAKYVHYGAAGAFGEALGGMPGMRVLSFSPDDSFPKVAPDLAEAYLAAIANATQLEALRLCEMTIGPDSLACLGRQKHLRFLSLKQVDLHRDTDDDRPMLSGLPPSATLETIEVDRQQFLGAGFGVGDDDLPILARLPRLKSLGLIYTDVTPYGLSHLAKSPSLEELWLYGPIASSAGFESLQAMKRLKRLHVEMEYKPSAEPSGALEMSPQVGPDDLEPSLRAMQALRRTHPGMVIDGDWSALSWDAREWISAEHDTRDRLVTSSVRDQVQKWKEAGSPPYPPAPGGANASGIGMF